MPRAQTRPTAMSTRPHTSVRRSATAVAAALLSLRLGAVFALAPRGVGFLPLVPPRFAFVRVATVAKIAARLSQTGEVAGRQRRCPPAQSNAGLPYGPNMAIDPTARMTAVLLTAHGGPDVLELRDDIPVPTPAAD